MESSGPIRENTFLHLLHEAVKFRDVLGVNQLLSGKTAKERILSTDKDGNSPLHLAFISQNIPIVNLILHKIKQLSEYTNLKNKQGLSHFHIACTAAQRKIVEGFLNAGVNTEDVVSEESDMWPGFTAAHFAIKFKSLEAFKVLLKFNVNMEIKNNAGETPLSLAYKCSRDWLIMIDLLKKKKGSRDFSNFHMACLTSDRDTVKKFIEHNTEVNLASNSIQPIQSSSSPLHCAVLSGDMEKVKLLLDNRAKLDALNSEKMTPLHLAFYYERPILHLVGRVQIMDLLYNAVQDKTVNHVDKHGLNYFHIAIRNNDLLLLKEYLDNGRVDVNKPLASTAPKFANYSPLHFAVEYQNCKAVELLVERGADVNAIISEKLETPLYMAFQAEDIELIEFLFKNGAEVKDIINAEQKTMLHILIDEWCYQTYSESKDQHEKAILLYMEQLVKLGVDINAKDNEGRTAMHLLFFNQDKIFKYFQLLLDLGADVNLENNQGELPFNLNNVASHQYIEKPCVIFYHHVQKLIALGMKIHAKNEELCKFILEKKWIGDEELRCRERQRLDEIEKMKTVMISPVTSVYDFLKLDVNRAALYARSKTLENIAEDEDLKKEYPSYAYLIQLQYRKAVDCLDSKVTVKRRSDPGTEDLTSAKRSRQV